MASDLSFSDLALARPCPDAHDRDPRFDESNRDGLDSALLDSPPRLRSGTMPARLRKGLQTIHPSLFNFANLFRQTKNPQTFRNEGIAISSSCY